MFKQFSVLSQSFCNKKSLAIAILPLFKSICSFTQCSSEISQYPLSGAFDCDCWLGLQLAIASFPLPPPSPPLPLNPGSLQRTTIHRRGNGHTALFVSRTLSSVRGASIASLLHSVAVEFVSAPRMRTERTIPYGYIALTPPRRKRENWKSRASPGKKERYEIQSGRPIVSRFKLTS